MTENSFKCIGINRHSIGIDGPGVTTLVAGWNCPLHCLYCINDMCHSNIYKEYTVSELIDVLSIDDLYFTATSGGVTFGGGEPLLQAEFIHEFKQNCPNDWKVNIETSLNVSNKSLSLIINDVDLMIIDLKTIDADIYKEYTGYSIDNLINNLKWIVDNSYLDKCYFRYPIIPGYTTESDVDKAIATLDLGEIHKFTYNLDIGDVHLDDVNVKTIMGKVLRE